MEEYKSRSRRVQAHPNGSVNECEYQKIYNLKKFWYKHLG